MDSSTSLQKIIDYRFKHDKLLNEAILAAGASVSDPHVDGDKQGNKSLALIGDALIRLAIADRGHAQGARAGKEQDLSNYVRLTTNSGEHEYCRRSRIKYFFGRGSS
jgi:ribonuclease-3